MSDTANAQTSAGQAGLLTTVLTSTDLVNQVNDTAAAVIPPAIASVIWRVDPLNRHLYRSRNGGPETDVGLVGGTRFWGPFSTVASMPAASDGVMSGDLAFNTNNQAFYSRQSGQWTSMGTLKGADGVGVVSTAIDANGNLTLTLSNAATLGPFAVKGPKGDQGIQGLKGDTGATGATGPSGIVAATAPLVYNATTKTVSIDLSAHATTAALTTAIAGVTLAFNAPMSKSGATVSIPAATATVDGYMPAATLKALQDAVTALQAESLKGTMGAATKSFVLTLVAGSQSLTIPLNSAMPDANYLALVAVTSTTGVNLTNFTATVTAKTTTSVTVSIAYTSVSIAATATVTVVALKLS